ncbi:MAG: hypothetical protein AAF799_39420 [Myxococcota bacterium]
MIIVTGTARSGTSMWMQILIAAGYPPIGEQFPRDWGTSLHEANRGGFWESTLREGINFQTNPNPETGTYIRPDQVTTHAVKVFIRGLVRSDLAYLGRVVATARHWRGHSASMRRLWALEDEVPGRRAPPRLDPALLWFAQNFSLLGDMALRGYPVRLCAYEDVIARPRETLAPILEWLGGGDLDAAVDAVGDRAPSEPDDESAHEHQDAFDILYQALRSARPPGAADREHLASAYAAIMPRISAYEDELDQLRARAGSTTSSTESAP